MKISIKYSIVIILLKVFVFSEICTAQKISSKDRENLETQITSFVVRYAEYAKLSSEGQPFSDDYAKKLIAMHKSGINTLVYCNIEPEKEAESISLQEYLDKLRINYNLGFTYKITVGAEISDIGLLSVHGKKLVAFIEIQKSFIGLYNNEKVHRADSKMYLVFSFNKLGGDMKVEELSQNLPSLFPLINYSYSQIELAGVLDYTEVTSASSSNNLWAVEEPSLAYSANINFTRYLGKNFGLGLGLDFSQIQYKFLLQDFSTKDEVTATEIDKDGDAFAPVYYADIDEETSLFLLNMPLYSELKFGGIDKVNLFFRGGLRLVYILDASVKSIGFVEKQGYYPDFDLLLFNLPAYGYETNNIDANKQIDLQKFNYLFFGSMGFFVPIKSRLILSIIGEYSVGIESIINTNSTYRDDYANVTTNPESIILNTYYAKIGIAYKFN